MDISGRTAYMLVVFNKEYAGQHMMMCISHMVWKHFLKYASLFEFSLIYFSAVIYDFK